MIVKAIVWSQAIRTLGVLPYFTTHLIAFHGFVVEYFVWRVEKLEVFRRNMRYNVFVVNYPIQLRDQSMKILGQIAIPNTRTPKHIHFLDFTRVVFC